MSVQPSPRAKNPTGGNEAEPSQRGVRAVIHSGNLCCVPPEGQAPQSRGRTQAGEEAAAPIPSQCHEQVGRGGLRESLRGEEDGRSHDTSTSCFLDLQLCLRVPTPLTTPTGKPCSCNCLDGVEGQGAGGGRGLGRSGIPKPSERLQSAALQRPDGHRDWE